MKPLPQVASRSFVGAARPLRPASPAGLQLRTRSRTVTSMSRYVVSRAGRRAAHARNDLCDCIRQLQHQSAPAIMPLMLPPVLASMKGYMPLKNTSPR